MRDDTLCFSGRLAKVPPQVNGRHRLPRLLGVVLYAATLLSFLLVGVVSSADGKRVPFTILLLALAFLAVLMIVVDLDQPQQRLLTVGQTALSDLLRQELEDFDQFSQEIIARFPPSHRCQPM